jgi:methionine synthase I (cobalamin-dependent)
MRNLKESDKALRELLQERILVLDGAMGTMLQQRSLTAADFGGAALEGCNENLVRTRPDVVLEIHRKYFEAGSNIVETNSFGGTPLVLAETGGDAGATSSGGVFDAGETTICGGVDGADAQGNYRDRGSDV